MRIGRNCKETRKKIGRKKKFWNKIGNGTYRRNYSHEFIEETWKEFIKEYVNRMRWILNLEGTRKVMGMNWKETCGELTILFYCFSGLTSSFLVHKISSCLDPSKVLFSPSQSSFQAYYQIIPNNCFRMFLVATFQFLLSFELFSKRFLH